ncbi:MAG: DUF4833 domain-containing protein [Candidatus Krumholzibacteria bacterium]|nr:DUF4833 domain-containing protein [Candidatus Krumholzibacteria bacterium]
MSDKVKQSAAGVAWTGAGGLAYGVRRMRHIILLLALTPPLSALADEVAPTAQRLFHIERNKNTNIVVYDAQVLPDSNLTEDDPVIVYWLKLAEGGHREELKGIEKKMAYGFDVESREGNRLVIEMVADVGRNLVVDMHEGTYRAFMEIDGRQTLLDKIYIFAKETFMLPSVKYLELFGTDVETGEDVYEKIEL